jgi:Protein of unknown function (DUF1186)/SEC-C motif
MPERIRSAAFSRQTYPLAAIAAYGPDASLATKLVVSVFKHPGRTEPDDLRSWTTDAVDVRHDKTVAAEVATWLKLHKVKDTVTHDRIIGCPHQEGIDYPLGRTCPHCPFWAGIDRFTHEPLVTPEPTMSPEEVVANLSVVQSVQPLEALASADAHRDALVDTLLGTIERVLADWRIASGEQAQLFTYTLYLLAKWRQPRAYPLVVQWLSLPDEGAFALSGDVATQDGARILAAVYDGDIEPIKALILNRDADEFCRAAGVSALALLAVWAEAPRKVIVDHFLWLAREGLDREPSQVWGTLAIESADIEALEVFPDLRRAYDEGLIDPRIMAPSELDEVEAAPPGRFIERTQDRHPPIDDVAEATRWWADFHRGGRAVQLAEQLAKHGGSHALHEPERMEPHRAPRKVGRNEPCPCGSGRKYKKCCGA